MALISKIFMYTAFFIVLHAAYSASKIKSSDDLPFDIKLQAILSFIAASFSAVWHFGTFENIASSNDRETYTSDFLTRYKSTTGFMTFRHRGQFRKIY